MFVQVERNAEGETASLSVSMSNSAFLLEMVL